eukprot:TRINITY_DN1789_c0_g1_i12.p1 TRINITY_DN1789_c0_g1~~TRINITY_DN1789_c0_g1_i12.p1  ORF type:complete len:351 (-),score=84.46 TRINITY_DN1789_c0_g1_i12:125-1177(-)
MEFVHSRSFIRCDIKSSNFLIGIGDDENLIYALDFGLARQYMNSINKKHIPFCEDKKLVGTLNFISANTHAGMEQSRRDDMESLGYMLIYLAKGKLPWQYLKLNTQSKYKELMDMKKSTSLNLLCEGLPTEFVTYLAYCRKLKFVEEPDYCLLKGLFSEAIAAMNYTCDYKFDWMPGSEKFDIDNDRHFANSSLNVESDSSYRSINTEENNAMSFEEDSEPEEKANNQSSANEGEEKFLSLSSTNSVSSKQEDSEKDESGKNKISAELLKDSANAEQPRTSLKGCSGNNEAELKEEEESRRSSLKKQRTNNFGMKELSKPVTEIEDAMGGSYSPHQESSGPEIKTANYNC